MEQNKIAVSATVESRDYGRLLEFMDVHGIEYCGGSSAGGPGTYRYYFSTTEDTLTTLKLSFNGTFP